MSHPERALDRLISKARAGDRFAQQELWRAHRRWVAAIILAHRPKSAEVDDLMQEVAVKLISRLTSLRENASFRPWLRQIAINVCRGAARSHRPMLHLTDSEPSRGQRSPHAQFFTHPATADNGVEAVAEQRDEAQRLMDQALSLPPEYREPLLLRCVRSLTYQQISELLDLPVTTIETRLARARKMLREELGENILTEGDR